MITNYYLILASPQGKPYRKYFYTEYSKDKFKRGLKYNNIACLYDSTDRFLE